MSVRLLEPAAVRGAGRRVATLVESLVLLAARLTAARETRRQWWGPIAARWDVEVALTAAAAVELAGALGALGEAARHYAGTVEQAQDDLRRLDAQLVAAQEQQARALFLWSHDDPLLRGPEPDAGPLLAALHWGRERVEERAVADGRAFAAALEAVPLGQRLEALTLVADGARLMRAGWTYAYALPLGVRGPVHVLQDGAQRATGVRVPAPSARLLPQSWQPAARDTGRRLRVLDRGLGRVGPVVSLSMLVETGNGSARSRLDKTMAVLDLLGLLLAVTPLGAARLAAWRGATLSAGVGLRLARSAPVGRALQGTAAAWTSGTVGVDLGRRLGRDGVARTGGATGPGRADPAVRLGPPLPLTSGPLPSAAHPRSPGALGTGPRLGTAPLPRAAPAPPRAARTPLTGPRLPDLAVTR